MAKDVKSKDANRDPITGAPGAHPVGTGLGAAAGGMAAGAAAGTVAGPVGTVAGAAVGAIVGGLAGKAAAEAIDPTAEEAYWKENYRNEPYYQQGLEYDHYAPAYRTGYEGRAKYQGRSFEDVEDDLEKDFSRRRGSSSLGWDQARPAAYAAWARERTSTQGKIIGSDPYRTADGPGPEIMSADTLEGNDVRNPQGEDLGKIEHIMIDVLSGRVAYAVLSFGGVFGIGDKLFAIPWTALQLDTDNKCFVLSTSKERLKQAEGFDKDHWPSMADQRWALGVHQFYSARPYWE